MKISEPSIPLHVHIAIIGTGFGGLGAACRLRQRGVDDFLLIERGNEVGGTWRDNTYPGAACDIRSDLYSFSFAPNPDWQHLYGHQPEILDYLRDVAKEFDIYRKVVFGAELERAQWDADASVWKIRTSVGSLTADAIISGHGQLVEPAWPSIPGLETFAGPRIHSARWNHGVDLTGKRIAVVGTGASSVQIVPELQKIAGSMLVFQRTPAWIIPRGDRVTSRGRRRAFRLFPVLQRIARAKIFVQAESRILGFRSAPVRRIVESSALRSMKAQVPDTDLQRKLTPHYPMGCKRVLISDDYYPALTKKNVALETEAIVKIEGNTFVTADGARRDFDVLVCGTGFNATEPPIARILFDKDGRSLSHAWMTHMEALHGTTVAGFPNLFLLGGPNTALGHNSFLYMIEGQINYALKALDALAKLKLRSLDARPCAQASYNRKVQRGMAKSSWANGSCASWYQDASGQNAIIWPFAAAKFRRTISSFRRREYVLR